MSKKNIEQQKESTSSDYLGMLEKEVLSQHDKAPNNEHSSLLKSLYRSVDLSMQAYSQAENRDVSHIENLNNFQEGNAFQKLHQLLEIIRIENKQSDDNFEHWKKNHRIRFISWFLARFTGSISLLVACIGIPGFLTFSLINLIYHLYPGHSEFQFICILLSIACMFASIIGGGGFSVWLIGKIYDNTPKIGILNKISLWLRPERVQEDMVNEKADRLKEHIQSLMTPEFQQKSLEFFARFRLDIHDTNTIGYDTAYQHLDRAFSSNKLDETITHYQSLLSYLNNTDENKRQEINEFIKQMDNGNETEKLSIHPQQRDALHQML